MILETPSRYYRGEVGEQDDVDGCFSTHKGPGERREQTSFVHPKSEGL